MEQFHFGAISNKVRMLPVINLCYEIYICGDFVIEISLHAAGF